MRPVTAKIFRRFTASTRGIAAVEFALVMPMLLVMFLSTFDAANAVAVYMKVRSASYVLGAVTNTYGTGSTDQISTTAMPGIAQAAGKVMAPYTGTPIVTLSDKSDLQHGRSGKLELFSQRNSADAGQYLHQPAHEFCQTYMRKYLPLLCGGCDCQLYLHASIRLLHHWIDGVFRHRVRNAACQHLHSIQRRPQQLLASASRRFSLKAHRPQAIPLIGRLSRALLPKAHGAA